MRGAHPADPAPPSTCRELRSTVTAEGADVVLAECAVPTPGEHDVVVRVEAAPVNPSDLLVMIAAGDVADLVTIDGGFRIPLGPRALGANRARLGVPMAVGNEGGGTVVAAGAGPEAQALVGTVVGFSSGDAFAEYRTVRARSCLPMPGGITAEQAAAAFVNPLTALGMVETMRREGHTALVHTVGASNLGLMLLRVCLADGVPLVNIVRRADHVELLRSLGAEHVVDAGAPSFAADLRAALAATNATIAFDAIGGGEMADALLRAMEHVASDGAPFSRYGSDTFKQVYLYGLLDRGPTVLHRDIGFAWSVGGWLLTPFLGRLDREDRDRLRRRVADEIATTFASRYGLRISLDEAVDPSFARRYARMASGDKALITPHG